MFFRPMCILESVQPFLHLSNIEIFSFSSFLIGKLKKSQNSNKVKNGCTNSRIRIVLDCQKLGKLNIHCQLIFQLYNYYTTIMQQSIL